MFQTMVLKFIIAKRAGGENLSQRRVFSACTAIKLAYSESVFRFFSPKKPSTAAPAKAIAPIIRPAHGVVEIPEMTVATGFLVSGAGGRDACGVGTTVGVGSGVTGGVGLVTFLVALSQLSVSSSAVLFGCFGLDGSCLSHREFTVAVFSTSSASSATTAETVAVTVSSALRSPMYQYFLSASTASALAAPSLTSSAQNQEH